MTIESRYGHFVNDMNTTSEGYLFL